LFVHGGKEITSAEGTTQGDPIAMPLYDVAITPLLRMVKSDDANEVRHVAAFAARNLRTISVVLANLENCVLGGIISLFLILV
jgi:hypothetical protein